MLTAQDLCALLAARICHDLINPVGAINNGVELMSMEGAQGRGAELALVRESVESAAARIRLIRVAFGTARANQYMGHAEILTLLQDWVPNARLGVEWQAEGDHSRLNVRRVLLGVMCAETALPSGGLLRVTRLPEHWQICARGPRLKVDADLWPLVTRLGRDTDVEISAARVQFALLRSDLAAGGGQARLTQHAEGIDLVLPLRQG